MVHLTLNYVDKFTTKDVDTTTGKILFHDYFLVTNNVAIFLGNDPDSNHAFVLSLILFLVVDARDRKRK